MSKTKATKTAAAKKESKPSKAFTDSESTNPSEMKTSEIRDLIDFISQSGLNEVDIETKELKLHVKREPDQKVFKSAPAPMVAPVALPSAVPVAVAAPVTVAPVASKVEKAAPAGKTV